MGKSSHNRKIWICRLQKEGQIIRRFHCPFCGYTKNFYGKEAKKFKKRVVGFTCPACKKKITDADINRTKGKGPKPKAQRRKRVKKKVIKDTPKAIVHPPVEQFDWRTSSPPPPGDRQRRGRAGWQPKQPQPTTRTLEDAVVEAFLSSPKRGQKK